MPANSRWNLIRVLKGQWTVGIRRLRVCAVVGYIIAVSWVCFWILWIQTWRRCETLRLYPTELPYMESVFSRSTNKMQLCNRIYYSKVYWRLNMFRAAHRSSSGALNCVCSLWFIYPCGDRPLPRFPTHPWQRPVTTWVYKPEAANTVWSSWWWAVCRSKHVEPSINLGIINSTTRMHLVGCFYWFILRCTDPWILNTYVHLYICTWALI